jgi:hypothetical protein
MRKRENECGRKGVDLGIGKSFLSVKATGMSDTLEKSSMCYGYGYF